MNSVLQLEQASSLPKPSKRRPPKDNTAVTTSQLQHELERWALFGVVLMVVMSAGLNGYANSQHATVPWAGWLMGIAIPVLVLILAKVAGLLMRMGKRLQMLARVTFGVTIALLALSVYHCGMSISLLTGSDLWLSLPMAVAIDGGLVCCELALLMTAKK